MVIRFGLLFILLWKSAIALATYGESCAALPREAGSYLIQDTAYGYIKNHLDMKTYVDGCKATGDDLHFCIANTARTIRQCNILKLGQQATVYSLTNSLNTDLHNPLIGNILLAVTATESKLCLNMATSQGEMPLLCRNRQDEQILGGETIEICQRLAKSCYGNESESQSLFSFSGKATNCLLDTLDKVFYVGNHCPMIDEQEHYSLLTPFPTFQKSMKLAVGAALIIYVIFYGFKLAMNGQYGNLNYVAIFLLKVILVAYFAVGLGPDMFRHGELTKRSGMTEIVLPTLVDLTTDFTEYVFDAAGAYGLCNFNKNSYKKGYEFYSLWDSIDCRIGYYLGLQALYNKGPLIEALGGGGPSRGGGQQINWGPEGTNEISTLNKPGLFKFFTVMFGYLMGGNIIVVALGIAFVISLISVLLYFISAYLVCMVTLYAMAYISPIFIPMILFERTKGYFDSWLRIVLSCTLQPAVIGGFIALLLTMYDSAIYSNCEFKPTEYRVGNNQFTTFEMQLPNIDPEKCENSLGHKLMRHYIGQGWEKRILILFEVPKIQDFLDLNLSLVYVLIYMIIFYYLIKSASEFASDLTGGPSVKSVTANPNALVDKAKGLAMLAMAGIQSATGGAKGIAQKLKDTAGGAKNQGGKARGGIGGASTAGGGAADKASTDTEGEKSSGGGAEDTVSTSGDKEDAVDSAKDSEEK